jgi:hypothetical protein
MNLVKTSNTRYIHLLLLVILSLFFRIYQINDRYVFDWDQEDDAIKVSEMIKTHKPRLIGPRVANESGFFVGPFHYYFLTPFYVMSKGNPYAGAYAAVFIGLLTTLVGYFIFSKIFNPQIALISSIFYAASPSVVSWNVMYTPILSMIIFYLCYLLIRGKKQYFPFLVFMYSFSFSTHLVPASLILPIIATLVISRFRPSSKQALLSIVLFIIPLLPLIIFDLRHNFINILSLKSFIFSSKQASESVHFLFLRSFWRSLNPLFLTNSTQIIITRIIFLIIILFEVLKTQNIKFRIFLMIWILSPIFILAFYSGNIPEYYYGTSLIIFPVLLAIFISRIKSKFLLIVFMGLFLLIQSQYFLTNATGITLKNKLDLAEYLVNQTQDKIFNLSYDLPLGFNSGYAYLFKYLGKEPQNIPQGHLYSVFLTSKPPSTGQIVFTSNALGLVRK